MPRDKDIKRIIRKRMAKTGESYTAARAHIVPSPTTRQRPTASAELRAPEALPAAPEPGEPGSAAQPGAAEPMLQPSAAKAPAAAVAPDFAQIAGMSDEAVAAKTGRDWAGWVATLDALDASALPHGRIADIIHEKFGVPGWWTQTVTVGYERIKGLRERGQRRSGEYEASKSRTFNVPVAVLFDAWADESTRRRWLTGAEPRVRTATRPRQMRLGWDDDTIVGLYFTEKGPAKSAVAVQHMKLPDRETADRLKVFWSERLSALAQLLASA